MVLENFLSVALSNDGPRLSLPLMPIPVNKWGGRDRCGTRIAIALPRSTPKSRKEKNDDTGADVLFRYVRQYLDNGDATAPSATLVGLSTSILFRVYAQSDWPMYV